MRSIRNIGFAVLAVAALAVVVVEAPSSGGPALRDQVSSALSSWSANEAGADSAPQQAVSAEWANKDLLAAIGRADAQAQDSQTTSGNRIAYLLAIAVFAICWAGVTGRGSRKQSAPNAPAVPVHTDSSGTAPSSPTASSPPPPSSPAPTRLPSV